MVATFIYLFGIMSARLIYLKTNQEGDEPESELSAIGYHFIGGILESATALSAFTNPCD